MSCIFWDDVCLLLLFLVCRGVMINCEITTKRCGRVYENVVFVSSGILLIFEESSRGRMCAPYPWPNAC